MNKEYDPKLLAEAQEDGDDLNHRKKVKKLLDERLERKRLKDEFKDDFDGLGDEIDWDELSK